MNLNKKRIIKIGSAVFKISAFEILLSEVLVLPFFTV